MIATSFEGKTAVIGEGCWIHPASGVIGDLRLGDCCIVHARPGEPAGLLDRAVDDEYRAAWLGFKQTYMDLCRRYREGFGR